MKQILTFLSVFLFVLLTACQASPPKDALEADKEDEDYKNPKYFDLEAVDLGLSVKWGSKNLDVPCLTRYTDYYAWGEVEIKDNYDWSTYNWGRDYHYYIQTATYSVTLTKYNTSEEFGGVDNKTVLDAEDDVARVELGGKWRIPTKEEWEELEKDCEWTYYRYLNNDPTHNGWIVKSKKNGNQIFLSTFYGMRAGDGPAWDIFWSWYWTSSLFSEDPRNAWVYVVSDPEETRIQANYLDYTERSFGLCIRPVTK